MNVQLSKVATIAVWVWATASSVTTVATAHGVDDCKYWYSWYPRSPLTQCSVHGHIYDIQAPYFHNHAWCGCMCGIKTTAGNWISKEIVGSASVYLYRTSYKAAPSSSTLLYQTLY